MKLHLVLGERPDRVESVLGDYNHGSALTYTQISAAHAETQQRKGKDAVKGVF